MKTRSLDQMIEFHKKKIGHLEDEKTVQQVAEMFQKEHDMEPRLVGTDKFLIDVPGTDWTVHVTYGADGSWILLAKHRSDDRGQFVRTVHNTCMMGDEYYYVAQIWELIEELTRWVGVIEKAQTVTAVVPL